MKRRIGRRHPHSLYPNKSNFNCKSRYWNRAPLYLKELLPAPNIPSRFPKVAFVRALLLSLLVVAENLGEGVSSESATRSSEEQHPLFSPVVWYDMEPGHNRGNAWTRINVPANSPVQAVIYSLVYSVLTITRKKGKHTPYYTRIYYHGVFALELVKSPNKRR